MRPLGTNARMMTLHVSEQYTRIYAYQTFGLSVMRSHLHTQCSLQQDYVPRPHRLMTLYIVLCDFATYDINKHITTSCTGFIHLREFHSTHYKPCEPRYRSPFTTNRLRNTLQFIFRSQDTKLFYFVYK